MLCDMVYLDTESLTATTQNVLLALKNYAGERYGI